MPTSNWPFHHPPRRKISNPAMISTVYTIEVCNPNQHHEPDIQRRSQRNQKDYPRRIGGSSMQWRTRTCEDHMCFAPSHGRSLRSRPDEQDASEASYPWRLERNLETCKTNKLEIQQTARVGGCGRFQGARPALTVLKADAFAKACEKAASEDDLQ
jgi:hypothetical protein